MKSVNPKLLYALLGALALAIFLHLSNPYKKYSTRAFWETAPVAAVAGIPEKALKSGNPNGSVLMWAAMGAKDPAILKALVDRGADVNESDSVFSGTPMSAAAGKSTHPEMIAMLVALGADVNKRVHNGETAAMIAAQYNHTPGVIEALKAAGADMAAKDDQGQTALDFAARNGNKVAEQALLGQ